MRFRQSLFWDVDPKTIKPKKHARYIIERIMDFGNDSETKRALRQYPISTLRNIVRISRVLYPKKRNFWRAKLGLKESELIKYPWWLDPTTYSLHKRSDCVVCQS